MVICGLVMRRIKCFDFISYSNVLVSTENVHKAVQNCSLCQIPCRDLDRPMENVHNLKCFKLSSGDREQIQWPKDLMTYRPGSKDPRG